MTQNKRVEKEIEEVINPIKSDWNTMSENDLEILMKKFGRICRSETNNFRKDILSDATLGQILLKIGNKYSNNSKILIELVTSIDNIHDRYGFNITEEIFLFLTNQIKNRKVNFYISNSIIHLKQFNNYKEKWEYIMSIPNISPKKKSIRTFQTAIEKYIDKIPNNLKDKARIVFENFLEKSENLHEATVNSYLSTIKKLN